MKRNRLNSMMAGIWIANMAVCLLVAGLVAWFRTPQKAEAISSTASQMSAGNPPKLTAQPSITPVPPPTRWPTITPWPTPFPGPSVTPMLMPPSNRHVIGYSIEKRPQEVYHFGQGPVNKLILAGMHGGSEWNTIELADELIAYMNDHPERIPVDTSLFILRDLNPDGTVRSHGVDGRVNANAVDLNHNWPYNWKADWPRDGG